MQRSVPNFQKFANIVRCSVPNKNFCGQRTPKFGVRDITIFYQDDFDACFQNKETDLVNDHL